MKEKKPDFLKRLGRKQRMVVCALKGGATLHRHFERETTHYWLEGHGEIPAEIITGLLSRELIAERGDGMFGIGMTYGPTERAHAVN